MNEGIPPAGPATLALLFNQQAINILNIENEFPHKAEVQELAAKHLLRVFTPTPEAPGPG